MGDLESEVEFYWLYGITTLDDERPATLLTVSSERCGLQEYLQKAELLKMDVAITSKMKS